MYKELISLKKLNEVLTKKELGLIAQIVYHTELNEDRNDLKRTLITARTNINEIKYGHGSGTKVDIGYNYGLKDFNAMEKCGDIFVLFELGEETEYFHSDEYYFNKTILKYDSVKRFINLFNIRVIDIMENVDMTPIDKGGYYLGPFNEHFNYQNKYCGF